MTYFVYWEFTFVSLGTPGARLMEFTNATDAVEHVNRLRAEHEGDWRFKVRVVEGVDATASLFSGHLR